eukprot:Mycagemm_TRINITY_DN11168_c0_g1::TRINITY_DN11168_c0_g1_i1::g.4526::m.4526 type:complete len:266 gc:universal TRINITY_DN11168_c0_g1_i1:56-853(+)
MGLIISPYEQFYNIIFHDIIRGVEFVVMAANMFLLFFLLSPLPFRFKTAVLNKVAASPKIRLYWPSLYWSTVTMLGLLLVDAMRQTWIYTQRVAIVQEAQLIGEQDNSVRYDMETHLLVAQRNLYLTGVTLFLFVCNQRFCHMLMRMQGYERDIEQLRKAADKGNAREEAYLHAKADEKQEKLQQRGDQPTEIIQRSAPSSRMMPGTTLETETDSHKDRTLMMEEAELMHKEEERGDPFPSDEVRKRQTASAVTAISAGGVANMD